MECYTGKDTPFYGMAVNDLGFVKGGTTVPNLMIQQSIGYVGIGTSSPASALTVQAIVTNNVMLLKQSNGNQMIAVNTFGGIPFQDIYQTDGLTVGIHLNSNGNTYFNNGSVGIGTVNPDQKLTVKGTIHSTSVLVDTSVPTPDYVFKSDYKLPALSEIKTYTDKNHHLPGMPAAAEIEKNGINLGEMNMALLKKVEELTLYLIEQSSENKEKDIKLESQQKQLA